MTESQCYAIEEKINIEIKLAHKLLGFWNPLFYVFFWTLIAEIPFYRFFFCHVSKIELKHGSLVTRNKDQL